jgi:hypothetical protein
VIPLGLLDTLGSVAPKCVDRSSSSNDVAIVQHTAWNEALLASSHRDPFSVDDQGVAALNNDHVFVVIMSVCCGPCGPVVSVHVQNAIWLPSFPSKTT